MNSKKLTNIGALVVGVFSLYCVFDPAPRNFLFNKVRWFYNSFNDSQIDNNSQTEPYQSPTTRPTDRELFPWEYQHRPKNQDDMRENEEEIIPFPIKTIDIKLC